MIAGLRSLAALQAGLANVIVGRGQQCLERRAASSLLTYLGWRAESSPGLTRELLAQTMELPIPRFQGQVRALAVVRHRVR